MTIELKNAIEASNQLIQAIRSEVEGVKSADALFEGKMARMEAELAASLSAKSALEARLNALETAAARPVSGKAAEAADECKSAFRNWLANPESFEAKQAFEQKALATTGLANVIPRTVSDEVIAAARGYSALAGLAKYVVTGTSEFGIMVSGGSAVTRGGETTVRGENTTSLVSKKADLDRCGFERRRYQAFRYGPSNGRDLVHR
ncbi:phage major capsid protein [Cereibacter sphaeroides]|nr:phage major capsid protein [Cereibacter sphaeroides]